MYITRDKNGNVLRLLGDGRRRKRKNYQQQQQHQQADERQSVLPVNKKFPYFFVQKHHQKKSFESKFKPKIQKAISDTEHTVLTEKNRRVHKNQITGTDLYIQPDEQVTITFQKSRRPHSDSPRRTECNSKKPEAKRSRTFHSSRNRDGNSG